MPTTQTKPESSVKTIRVAMADDHKLFAGGIHSMLNNAPGIKCHIPFINGKLLLDWYDGANADVLLVDIEMPVLNGIDTSKQLLARYPAAKIIILSAFGKPETIQITQQIGVCAYLLKDAEPKDFIQTIFKVNVGEKVFAENLLTCSENSFEKNNAMALKITSREMEILKLIISGKTNSVIADELNISGLTVKKHRENLMHKFHSKNIAQLIAQARAHAIV